MEKKKRRKLVSEKRKALFGRKSRRTFLLILVLTLALGALIFLGKYLVFFDAGHQGPAETQVAFLSPAYIQGLLPLLSILGMGAAGILISLLFLRFYNHQKAKGNPGLKARVDRGKRRQWHSPSLFMALRLAILSLFSFCLIFGGYLFGRKAEGIGIPVLSCPWNRSQMLEASCYYLSHPEKLLELPLGEILLFLFTTLAFTALLGRFLCGFLCPMGLVQDGMDALRRKARIGGIAVNERTTQKLSLVRWALVLLFLGIGYVGGDFCTFCPAIAISPILSGMSASLYLSGFVMVLVLIGSFFKRRLWCNVCPLGYLVGQLHKVSLFRIRKDCTACTECGACYEACPMGIQSIYTEREKEDVTKAECILCGECVRRCPEDGALHLDFAGIPLYRASRMRVLKEAYGAGCGKEKP
ncbi:MAG: 4Fe-4S binding protein [Blautia sp.]|nr:4Fe-4S binding protein [Blautia sp.]